MGRRQTQDVCLFALSTRCSERSCVYRAQIKSQTNQADMLRLRTEPGCSPLHLRNLTRTAVYKNSLSHDYTPLYTQGFQ